MTLSYTVGKLAALAGVTVRMLHHYDRIGLLEPDERTGSGHYRRYGPESVERLHRILSYRELGLSLDEIATLLDDPHADRLAHLRRQERLLRDRIGRLEEMVGWLLVIRARPAWSWFDNGPGPRDLRTPHARRDHIEKRHLGVSVTSDTLHQ